MPAPLLLLAEDIMSYLSLFLLLFAFILVTSMSLMSNLGTAYPVTRSTGCEATAAALSSSCLNLNRAKSLKGFSRSCFFYTVLYRVSSISD
jgi:hypothetical protein